MKADDRPRTCAGWDGAERELGLLSRARELRKLLKEGKQPASEARPPRWRVRVPHKPQPRFSLITALELREKETVALSPASPSPCLPPHHGVILAQQPRAWSFPRGTPVPALALNRSFLPGALKCPLHFSKEKKMLP